MNIIAPKGNNDAALQYISERKYCSYSSLKHVRDCTNPYIKGEFDQRWGDIGTETHSRWLEGKSCLILQSPAEELMVSGMVKALNKNKVAIHLLKNATGVEQLIDKKLDGVPFIGYIDLIKKRNYAGDLKTFGHTNESKFITDQDFLQPACYMKAEYLYEFYYIGVSKVSPHQTCTFSVNQFYKRLNESKLELTKLLKYVKKKCF